MKKYQNKKIALMLVLMLIVPIFWNQNAAVAYAATTPTFVQSKVEVVGEGETYQLEIKDKVAGSTYKWSSSNTKVAKVTSKGIVNTVDKGTTTIKCKITYPSKKTKTLSCKVTVTIPATEINISNAVEVNGAHILKLNETYNFDQTLVPAKSSDKIFWSIGGGDAACIRIDNAAEGTITATKAGKVILSATAAKAATKESAALSIVNDAIIIEVVGPSATVGSANIVGSNEIRVVFDSPVDRNTVIGVNNKLSDNIEVTMKMDTKKVLAKDPGLLTASLSADLKTLTITSVNMFEGEYGINFKSNIKTTDGLAIEQYYKQLSYIDSASPEISSVDLDDTGMIVNIKFTEPVDFTNLKVSNATVVTSTGTNAGAEQTTISTLNNKNNYIASADKKSLTINMSKIAYTDYGKLFSVIFTGITDLSGNTPSNYTLTAILRTDTGKRAQATPISIIRTSYYTLSATFDRAIQFGGMITISGGATLNGVVDPSNNKKVNYTLSETDALLTGFRTVSIGFWNSYNVIESDSSSQKFRDFSVDFTSDKTSPVLSEYKYDAATGVLTLTYNKDINLPIPTGIFNATLVTVSDDIKAGNNINYTMIADADSKVIQLKLTNMTLIGDYTFTLDQGLVMDNYKNNSLSRAITISNKSGTSSELPGPYLIAQSSANLSEISLLFANKLDLASAQNIGNYSIPGVTIIAARVTNNTSDNGATVVLTVGEGAIDVTVERPITISGVAGYNGNYGAITTFTKMVELKDNKKPNYIDPPVFSLTGKNIRLNFNEQIQGTMTVKVTQIIQNGTSPIEYANSISVSGNSVYINLGSMPLSGTYLQIEILTNNITDLSGNAASAMASRLGVVVSY